MSKRILVTGSRDWDDVKTIETALRDAYFELVADNEFAPPPVLVHGECHVGGADIIARDVWKARRLPDEPHPADWKAHGKKAGCLRNAEMVELGADLCLAFIKNDSAGASHTAALAERAGIPVRRFTA